MRSAKGDAASSVPPPLGRRHFHLGDNAVDCDGPHSDFCRFRGSARQFRKPNYKSGSRNSVLRGSRSQIGFRLAQDLDNRISVRT